MSRKLEEIVPYTYLVKNKTTGYFYYGVKFSSYDAHPDLFWKRYFTSSKVVHQLIEEYGKDDFEVEIRKTFPGQPQKAIDWEYKVLKKIINWDKCINMAVGGAVPDSNKGRKLRINGNPSSYDLSKIKVHETKNNDIVDGKNVYQRAYEKSIKNNPDMIKKMGEKTRETRLRINPETGLNSYQEQGLNFRGENNSSKRIEVKEKISNGQREWIKNNPEEFKEHQDKINFKLNNEIKEDGLTERQRHSKFMTKEGNPAYNTIWINNGNENIRFSGEIIPDGFKKGRIKFGMIRNYIECIHCKKVGSTSNMKRYHFDNCKNRK